MLAIPLVLFVGVILGYFFTKSINLSYYALGIAVTFILYFVIANLFKSVVTTNEILIR